MSNKIAERLPKDRFWDLLNKDNWSEAERNEFFDDLEKDELIIDPDIGDIDPKDLIPYQGKWVGLSKNKVVTFGDTCKECMDNEETFKKNNPGIEVCLMYVQRQGVILVPTNRRIK